MRNLILYSFLPFLFTIYLLYTFINKTYKPLLEQTSMDPFRPSPLVIQGILTSVFHSATNIDSIQFIPHGTDVYAFKAVAPEIGLVVVKVRRDDKENHYPHFFAHFWATNAWRSKSLPAPQVYFFDSDSCVEECMPGHHPKTPLSSTEQDRFLIHMADLFHRLHSVPCPYYGRIKERNKDPSNWVKTLLHTFEFYFYSLHSSSLLSHQDLDALETLVAGSLPQLTPKKPSLLHGDLHSLNYLVDDSQTITGVLDASESLGGDPHYDLAHFTNAHPQFQQRISTLYSHYPECDVNSVRVYRAALAVRKLIVCGVLMKDKQRITREKANLLALL